MRPRTSITGTISVILITALLTPEVQGATDTRTATLESVYTTNTVRTINNVKRGDPVESRADFFGYLLLNDGTCECRHEDGTSGPSSHTLNIHSLCRLLLSR